MLDSCAYRIAVIGAGVAGGTCASRLLRLPGVHTTIYDMGSRGPGGRACSRPVDGKGGSFSPADRGGASSLSAPQLDLTFDHGVQAFTVRDPEVAELVAEWCRAGHVQRWQGRFGQLDATSGLFTRTALFAASGAEVFAPLAGENLPLYVGVPTMSGLVSGMLEAAAAEAEAAAAGAALTTLWGCKATEVRHAVEGHSPSGARWSVASSDGQERHFDAVVLAGHAASMAAGVAATLPGIAPAAEEEAAAGEEEAEEATPYAYATPEEARARLEAPQGRRGGRGEEEAAGGTGGEGEDAALLRRLRGVSYPKGVSPLYALMVAFEAPIGDAAPFEGAYVANSRALRWITRDTSKPGRARPPGDCRELWVALSTESFAREVAGRRGGAGPDAQGGARPTERQLQARARSMSPRPSRASLAAHEQPPRPQRPSRTPRRPRVVAFTPSGRTSRRSCWRPSARRSTSICRPSPTAMRSDGRRRSLPPTSFRSLPEPEPEPPLRPHPNLHPHPPL